MKTAMISKTFGLCAVGFALAATSSYANLVIDGGFASPSGGASFETIAQGGKIGAWSVTAGSVDLIGGYWVSSQPGQQSVDMAGFYANGKIEQQIATVANGSYLLTFDLAGNPDGLPVTKELEVIFGNATRTFAFTVPAGATHGNMGWTSQSWILNNVPAGAKLSFQDVSDPINGSPTAFGAVIDNVSVTAVPEPSTIIAGALLLLPFGVSTLRSLRRNQA